MKRLILIISAIWMATVGVFAQDYTFSNHNIVPFSLNPAMAGNANAIRLGLNFRQQWPTLGNKYNTVRASYDQNFYKRMCSAGLAYAMDSYAGGIYRTNEIGLVYAHTFQLKAGKSNKFSSMANDGVFLRLGVQGTCFINKFDVSKVSFADQYDLGTGNLYGPTTEEFESDRVRFVDFNAGAALNIQGFLTLGAAMYHMSEPENGFQKLGENVLHRRFAAHVNYIKDLELSNGLFGRNTLSDTYLFANASYQKQDVWKQLDLGAGGFFAPFMAGISMKTDLSEVSYVSFMVGASIKNFQAYYVYDLFTSQKKNGSWSHEIALIYIIRTVERYPCPVVYW
ncbi:MAG: PorP/SprF family type IX secretion system membrane protein [Bacteroidales bacterium]|nr:PorP/SprF family type IX secretion system membrane protein [Candidatus Scybalocola fimicaballi]